MIQKLKGVEIVKKKTKQRYKRILEMYIEQVEAMRANTTQLSGVRKALAILEIIKKEAAIDKKIKRIAEMITVEADGEVFAEQ